MRIAVALMLLCGPVAAGEWNPFADAAASPPCVCDPATCRCCAACPCGGKGKGTESDGKARQGTAKATEAPAIEWLILSASWCGPCRSTLAAASGLPVRSIDYQSPEAIALFGGSRVTSLPTVVLLRDGVPVGWKAGGLSRAAWLRLAAEQGVEPKPVAVAAASPAPVRRPALVYRGSGAAWSWPGDLRNHLRTTHGIDGANLSDADAIRTHDAAHGSRASRPPLATGFIPAMGGR